MVRWRKRKGTAGMLDDISIFYYGALPVELTSFTAKAENNNVMLNWETATELNNLGFEIQRSKELNPLISGWHTLGFVKGRGTSVTSSSYSFTDKNPYRGNNITE